MHDELSTNLACLTTPDLRKVRILTAGCHLQQSRNIHRCVTTAQCVHTGVSTSSPRQGLRESRTTRSGTQRCVRRRVVVHPDLGTAALCLHPSLRASREAPPQSAPPPPALSPPTARRSTPPLPLLRSQRPLPVGLRRTRTRPP